jgi:hypothetical protein
MCPWSAYNEEGREVLEGYIVGVLIAFNSREKDEDVKFSPSDGSNFVWTIGTARQVGGHYRRFGVCLRRYERLVDQVSNHQVRRQTRQPYAPHRYRVNPMTGDPLENVLPQDVFYPGFHVPDGKFRRQMHILIFQTYVTIDDG